MTRVIVVAGYSAVRAGLQTLLADDAAICVLGDTTAEAQSLAHLIADLQPDVLLIDSSADGSGVDSLGRVLAALNPSGGIAAARNLPAIVAVGNAPERDLMRLASADLPGWGYLLRGDAAGSQIVGAVRAAAAGLVVLDTALPIARAWSESAQTVPLPTGAAAVPGETLTPREMEVLELMAEGLPNKIIASRLKISLHTAKFHVAQILGKLDAASRTEAVTIGARRGFLTL